MCVALDVVVRLMYWGKIVVDESGMKHDTAWDNTVVGARAGHNETLDGATVPLPSGSNMVLTAW
jgi:hypothetical protein